ncbi:MAG TPA: hypothetical protein DIV39_05435 [Verrucomicrobiales bacterium]|nr:hypothetical protein [Verrucomicrobiales bacterium]
MRQYIGILIGALLGALGAILFGQSLRPDPGSVQERAEHAEHQLRVAEAQLRSLQGGRIRADRQRSAEGARDILEDIREGRGADLDDIFAVTKPWLNDLSPVINLMRSKEEKEQFARLAGDYTRKYDLNESQQKQLRQWLDDRATENAERFVNVVANDSSTMYDLILAGKEAEQNIEGIDQFMEQQLTGETLVAFRADRLQEKIDSVEGEANGRLNNLDSIVNLDASQEDQLFFAMARSSEDYIPSMDIEGMDDDRSALDREGRNVAIESILTSEQQELLESHRQNRRQNAEEEMRAIGLRLPENWQQFEDDDW